MFIHHIGTPWVFIPLDCVFTPLHLHVSVLPCVDCTPTEVFEQSYLLLTPQTEYGGGKRICPAVEPILCTTAKFYHCLAESNAHVFYIFSSSPTKHHTGFLEPKDCFLCQYLMTQNTSRGKGQHSIFQSLLDRTLIPAVLTDVASGLLGVDKFVWNRYLYSHVHTGVPGRCI